VGAHTLQRVHACRVALTVERRVRNLEPPQFARHHLRLQSPLAYAASIIMVNQLQPIL
jgi:hypothetical protein